MLEHVLPNFDESIYFTTTETNRRQQVFHDQEWIMIKLYNFYRKKRYAVFHHINVYVNIRCFWYVLKPVNDLRKRKGLQI